MKADKLFLQELHQLLHEYKIGKLIKFEGKLY